MAEGRRGEGKRHDLEWLEAGISEADKYMKGEWIGYGVTVSGVAKGNRREY